jgi:hypothetical protein
MKLPGPALEETQAEGLPMESRGLVVLSESKKAVHSRTQSAPFPQHEFSHQEAVPGDEKRKETEKERRDDVSFLGRKND